MEWNEWMVGWLVKVYGRCKVYGIGCLYRFVGAWMGQDNEGGVGVIEGRVNR